MKNVFMILFFLGGLFIQNLDAQQCRPCPPGCCLPSCCLSGKSGAATSALEPSAEATFAALMKGAAEPDCQSHKMSKKEMKSCVAACKALGQVAPDNMIHTTSAANAVYNAGASEPIEHPACQAICKPNPSCKSTSTAAAVDPAPSQVRVREKS